MHAMRNLLGACLLSLPFAVSADMPVNINTANSETLVDGLAGVGPQKALAIVRYRQQHGPFKNVEELARVDGIGARTVELNRSKITLSAPAATKK